MSERKIIAVDFDGTLCESKWPEIGAPNIAVINKLIQLQAKGARIILWTCRNGPLLDEAVRWCSGYGLHFDAVNDNVSERIALYGINSRKVSADEYWDDKNVVFNEPTCDSCKFRKQSRKPERNIYSWCANNCKNFSSSN